MLSIADPHAPVLDGSLDAPGGFAWWYLDLVDERGNGIVVIPSWGLPFLPGQMASARAGEGAPARERPSLAVSVYEKGLPVYYLLQEMPCAKTMREGHTLILGDSMFVVHDHALVVQLDVEGPGGRLKGRVDVCGVPRAAGAKGPLAHADHEWCPFFGPATGRWDLEIEGRRMRGEGSAYADRNAGRADLASLGLRRWTWARVQLGDRLRVGYVIWPRDGEVEAMLVDVDADGQMDARRAEVVVGASRTNVWGLPWWPHLELTAGHRRMAVDVRHRPDESFFYQRSLASVETELGEALGVAELCDVDRIDAAWSRPLVDMAIHRPSGRSSMWLPLFAGPVEGRLSRLLGA
ncbi:MAG: hypothetical protein GY913_35815 [Proteobacteria bacterium]|nr:hypothetical protein [Pseudomonadota bacterium]MCP4922300.1 hypothetical protein [Pseudomonadota bacterium]